MVSFLSSFTAGLFGFVLPTFALICIALAHAVGSAQGNKHKVLTLPFNLGANVLCAVGFIVGIICLLLMFIQSTSWFSFSMFLPLLSVILSILEFTKLFKKTGNTVDDGIDTGGKIANKAISTTANAVKTTATVVNNKHKEAVELKEIRRREAIEAKDRDRRERIEAKERERRDLIEAKETKRREIAEAKEIKAEKRRETITAIANSNVGVAVQDGIVEDINARFEDKREAKHLKRQLKQSDMLLDHQQKQGKIMIKEKEQQLALEDASLKVYDQASDIDFKKKAANLGVKVADRSIEDIARNVLALSSQAAIDALPDGLDDVTKAKYILDGRV